MSRFRGGRAAMDTSYRISLRRYIDSDREDFVNLNIDPIVRKSMNGALTAENANSLFYRVISDEFAFAVIENDSNDIVGHIFLSETGSPDEREIGFLFFRQFWGKGFATEACAIMIKKLVNVNFKRLIATIDTDHQPSIRVLLKSGFDFYAREQDELGPYLVYKKELGHQDQSF